MKEQLEPPKESKVEFLPPDGNKAYTYTKLLFDLLLPTGSRKSFNPLSQVKEFLSWVDSIASSEIRKKLFYYFLDNRVATAPVILLKTGLSETSTYREIRSLCQLQVIEPIINKRFFTTVRGRPVTVYGLKDLWVPDDIVKAIQTHNQLKSRSFVLVSKIGQSIIDDYITVRNLEEISMREVVALCKGNCKGYYSFDVADQVATFLSNQGVKVWR